MKSVKWRTLITTCMLCLIPLAIGAFYYNQLPQQIPAHFNFRGEVDAKMSKEVILFLFPIAMTIFQGVFCYRCDVINHGIKTPRIEYVHKMMIPISSILVSFLCISYSLGIAIDVSRAMMICMGLILILMGNYLPKTSSNYLTSHSMIFFLNCIKPELRKKMNRIYGYTSFGVGIIYLLTVFFDAELRLVIVIASVVCFVAISMYYGYYMFKNYSNV